MIAYIFLFLSSYVLVKLLTPLSILLANKFGAVDVPTQRKVHTAPVPRLGGVAVLLAATIPIVLGEVAHFWSLLTEEPGFKGMIAGSVLIVGVGLWDDTRNARPLFKFTVQLLAASLAVAWGVQFELASNPFVAEIRDYFDLGVFAFPLSILWIVALTNAMNLIDGLDGLATGIALSTSVTLFLISLEVETLSVSYLYLTLAGATLGFLGYNRYPAKVFLGDTGSMFLGFSLGCLSIIGFQKSFTLSSFVIPIVIFGIPIFDSIVALTRRYINGKGIASADREHLHHRLMDLGLSQRQTVLLLYFITVLLGIIAFAFTVQLSKYAALIVAIIGILGSMLAKELNLFALRPRQMERRYFSEEQEIAKSPEGIERV